MVNQAHPTDEARWLSASLDVIELEVGAIVLRKEIEGHLIAVVMPSMRSRDGDPTFTEGEASRLWSECCDALQDFVDGMRRTSSLVGPPSKPF